jgi:hypothetical protein
LMWNVCCSIFFALYKVNNDFCRDQTFSYFSEIVVLAARCVCLCQHVEASNNFTITNG